MYRLTTNFRPDNANPRVVREEVTVIAPRDGVQMVMAGKYKCFSPVREEVKFGDNSIGYAWVLNVCDAGDGNRFSIDEARLLCAAAKAWCKTYKNHLTPGREIATSDIIVSLPPPDQVDISAIKVLCTAFSVVGYQDAKNGFLGWGGCWTVDRGKYAHGLLKGTLSTLTAHSLIMAFLWQGHQYTDAILLIGIISLCTIRCMVDTSVFTDFHLTLEESVYCRRIRDSSVSTTQGFRRAAETFSLGFLAFFSKMTVGSGWSAFWALVAQIFSTYELLGAVMLYCDSIGFVLCHLLAIWGTALLSHLTGQYPQYLPMVLAGSVSITRLCAAVWWRWTWSNEVNARLNRTTLAVILSHVELCLVHGTSTAMGHPTSFDTQGPHFHHRDNWDISNADFVMEAASMFCIVAAIFCSLVWLAKKRQDEEAPHIGAIAQKFNHLEGIQNMGILSPVVMVAANRNIKWRTTPITTPIPNNDDGNNDDGNWTWITPTIPGTLWR